jgi:fatty acid desaturase
VSLPAASEAPRSKSRKRAIDDAIRAIPAEWFKASPVIYWSDFLGSSIVGWTTFVLAMLGAGWTRAAFFAVSTLALYRAVLFIHEITHRAQRDVPAFTLAWNVLIGVPLLVPSFLYEGVHTDHHRQRTYGTDADPEYVPFGHRSPALMAGYVIASLLAPLLFVLRFALLAPLSWIIPPLRRLVIAHGSALVINHLYVRQAPIPLAGRVQEVAACALCWTSAALFWTGRLPPAVLFGWAGVSALASGVNAARTLAAHRYDHDEPVSEALSMNEQLLDSCTISTLSAQHSALAVSLADAGRALVAPVGLRYHALHHWIPSLPYHNLGRAHRLLVSALSPDAPYGATIEDGFTPALRDLVHRAGSRSRRGR